MPEILIAVALMMPTDYVKNVQWFGVTERTLIHRSGMGVRLSVWCNDEIFVGLGRHGRIFQQWKLW